MVGCLCLGLLSDPGLRYKEDFDDLIECDFEFLKIPVFRNYDRNLKLSYGNDYMTPIKVSNCHGGVFFDTDKSYTEHFKGNKFYE